MVTVRVVAHFRIIYVISRDIGVWISKETGGWGGGRDCSVVFRTTSEGNFPRRASPHSLFKPLPQWSTKERGNVRK